MMIYLEGNVFRPLLHTLLSTAQFLLSMLPVNIYATTMAVKKQVSKRKCNISHQKLLSIQRSWKEASGLQVITTTSNPKPNIKPEKAWSFFSMKMYEYFFASQVFPYRNK